jgi:hypothetical protein
MSWPKLSCVDKACWVCGGWVEETFTFDALKNGGDADQYVRERRRKKGASAKRVRGRVPQELLRLRITSGAARSCARGFASRAT